MKIKIDKSEKNIDSYVLPKENSFLEKFIIKNKEKLLIQVIDCIENAVLKNKEYITIFTFEDSKFFVSVKKEDYLENIRNVFLYFYTNKNPEICTRISRIEDKLIKK